MYKIYVKEQRYKDLLVLKNLRCNIDEGDFVVIMGESGCGKTTFLNVISGLLLGYEGEIYFEDNDISKKSSNQLLDFRRENLGMIFQDFKLIDFLNVEENIRIINKSLKDNELDKILNRLEISDIQQKTINQCSGGQKQRVAIARVLAGKKRIILADEPTASLDSRTSKEIMDIFLELNKEGYTIVMITHSPQIASYANRILYLYEGSFKEERNMKDMDQKEKLKEIIGIIEKHYDKCI